MGVGVSWPLIAALAGSISLLNVPLNYATTIWVVPIGLLVYAVWHRLPGVRIITRSRWLQYVGTRSYSWYLLHWPFLMALMALGLPEIGDASVLGYVMRLGIMVAVTAAAAELSYRFLEEPARQWGRNLLARWQWASTGRIPPAERFPNERRAYEAMPRRDTTIGPTSRKER